MQRNFTNLMRISLAAIAVVCFSGVANAEYPAKADIVGKYTFKGTKARYQNSTDYADIYNALPEEFEFEITSGSSNSIGLTDFLGIDDIIGNYDSSDGQIIISRMSTKNETIYIAPEGTPGYDGYNANKVWQVSEDGLTITIPNFLVVDWGNDDTFAQYTNITCTKVVVNPTITISKAQAEVDGEDVTMTVEVALTDLEPASSGVWKANVAAGDATKTYDVTYSADDSTATFVMEGLETGTYSYSITISYAETADATPVVSNELKDITVNVGTFLKVSNVFATPDYTSNTIGLTFDVQSFNLGDLSEGEEYTYTIDLTEDDINVSANPEKGETITFDAEVDGLQGEAEISELNLNAGTYYYKVAVNAYHGTTLAATTLTPASLSFTLTQAITSTPATVEGIMIEEGNARYFTIGGVEVAHPQKGQILIRVSDGKTTKVIK